MRKLGWIVCSIFLFSLLSSASNEKSSKVDLYFLRKAIDRTIQEVDPNAHIGIEIISLKDGQKLYERNAKHMFVPASAQKIFTAASALSVLGADYRFETRLFRQDEVKEGILQGDLYLKGGGDPSLTTADLKKLAFQLSRTGIKTIQGDLVIDNFDFDNISQGPGWMWDEGAEYWNSPIDALLVNHSCVTVYVEPGAKENTPAAVAIHPKIEGVNVQNFAKTIKKNGELSISRRWVTKENLIEIGGTISLQSPGKQYEIPVESPSLYAAILFRDLLAELGIQLTGKITFKQVPEWAETIAVHRSVTLSEIVNQVMKESDNLYSNCIFKKMGEKLYKTPGTWKKGAQALRVFLSDTAKINVDDLAIVDGDGESRYNLVSPHQLVTFLAWMKDQSLIFPEFLSSMPLSGIDGSLQRMNDPLVKGRIRAKPGTMTGISSLAGYATTQDGEQLAFAIMINGFVKPAIEYKKNLEDRICTLLAQFSRMEER